MKSDENLSRDKCFLLNEMVSKINFRMICETISLKQTTFIENISISLAFVNSSSIQVDFFGSDKEEIVIGTM